MEDVLNRKTSLEDQSILEIEYLRNISRKALSFAAN